MGFLWLIAFDFSGRIGRQEFWARMLTSLAGYGLVRGIVQAIAFLNSGTPHYAPTALDEALGTLAMIAFLLLVLAADALAFMLAVGSASTIVCRLHDRRKSGWWLVAYAMAAYQLVTGPSLWQHIDLPDMIATLVAAGVLISAAVELGILPGAPAEPAAAPT